MHENTPVFYWKFSQKLLGVEFLKGEDQWRFATVAGWREREADGKSNGFLVRFPLNFLKYLLILAVVNKFFNGVKENVRTAGIPGT